jgi:hypothetical protein
MIPDEHVSDEDLGAEAELFFKIGPWKSQDRWRNNSWKESFQCIWSSWFVRGTAAAKLFPEIEPVKIDRAG